MPFQALKSKQAEIDYRRRRQSGEFDKQEPSDEELTKILNERVERTLDTFKRLKKKGVTLSPFLEIGAERGQRTMALASKFNAHGWMLDLSLDSLNSAAGLKSKLNLPVLPSRICADAEALPFPNASLSFVFAFQTLHHFTNPKPIVKEIHRVLSPGGIFFFDEEPIRQSLNLRLWRRPTKLRWWEQVLKATGLLHFLSEIGKTEVDSGIVETSFDLPTWEKSLDLFEEVEARITVFPFGPSQTVKKTKTRGWLKPTTITNILLELLGGNIEVICKKRGKLEPTKPVLSCPSCRNHPHLKREKNSLVCQKCNDAYPVKNNIPILIKKDLRHKLYG